MNNQNDDYNSQLNAQSANNSNNQPAQSLSNKFFPADLFPDSEINEVGSSTTSGANSQFISKKTWGVGGNASNMQTPIQQVSTPNTPEVLDLFGDEVETLLDDVNGMVPGMEPQENNTVSYVEPAQVYQPPQSNLGVFQQFEEGPAPAPVAPDLMAPMATQTPDLMAPMNQEMTSSPTNEEPVQEWMENQPLSVASLGVVSLSEEDAPKEIVDDSKFFNQAAYELAGSNQITVEKEEEPVRQQSVREFLDQYEEPKPEIDEVKLYKEYVGEDFTKITMSPFSFSALLFGSIYFLYRKMYILGVIVFAISFVISNMLPSPISLIGVLVFHLVLALAVNQIYLKTVARRVKWMIKRHPKMNQYELSKIANKKGGTNFLFAILGFIGLSIVGFGVSVVVLGVSMITSLFSSLGSPTNTPTQTNKPTYNGSLVVTDYDVRNIYNIEMPFEFNQVRGYAYLYYTYDTNDNTEYNKCEFTFGAVDGYTSGETLIKEIAKYNKDAGSVSSTENKNITWYNFYTEDDNNKLYYRGTTYDGKAILLEYKIGINSEPDVCDAHYVNILDSISLK